jgi:hypothetical protein
VKLLTLYLSYRGETEEKDRLISENILKARASAKAAPNTTSGWRSKFPETFEKVKRRLGVERWEVVGGTWVAEPYKELRLPYISRRI